MGKPIEMIATTPSITVVYALSHNNIWMSKVELLALMTVQQVIQASGFEAQYPNIDWQACGVGIFGKQVKAGDVVKPGDRVEIYRKLVFDPKESRRRRALHRQRQKQTGDLQSGRQRTV